MMRDYFIASVFLAKSVIRKSFKGNLNSLIDASAKTTVSAQVTTLSRSDSSLFYVEVSRFVYLPYGELNESLTTTDPDGDGKHFNITEKYTGQEYDYETGLYNYKARLYDPDSGRFLQTDPKHKDMPGWSNYDRYGYVHGNPINLIDPSGEIAWQLWAQIGVMKHGSNSQTALQHNVGVGTKAVNSMVNTIQKNPWLLAIPGVQGAAKLAARNTVNTIKRITNGRKYNDSHNFFDVAARKYGEVGTFIWRDITQPDRILGQVIGVLDLTVGYTTASINGDPRPKLHYSNGGYWIENSQFFPVYRDYIKNKDSVLGVTNGNVAFTPAGASLDTIRHEKGHIQQHNKYGFAMNYISDTTIERDNDYTQFTFGYTRPIDICL